MLNKNGYIFVRETINGLIIGTDLTDNLDRPEELMLPDRALFDAIDDALTQFLMKTLNLPFEEIDTRGWLGWANYCDEKIKELEDA